MKRTEQY